jgi:glycosyltransferase involved in cell wall biosynthesis
MPATHASRTGTLVFNAAETAGARPRLKILFVAQRYHPYVGGVETQTRLVLNELARQHHVEVAAIQFQEIQAPTRLSPLEDSLLLPAFESYVDGDVPVHALTPTVTDRLRMLPIAARCIPRLMRYRYHALRRFGYPFFRNVYAPKLRALMEDVDVVHSIAGGYLGWTAQEVAREFDVPFVVTPYVHPGQHGADADSVAYYQRSDAVLALLETDRELLAGLGVPRELLHLYGVVPLLPETADGAGFRTRHGLGDAPLILFVGRMVGYKGIVALADAAHEVWETIPDAQFVFIGPVDDDMKAELASIDPRIHVLGFVSKQEKADAYDACTLFCMPSKFEILPAVYLEAWSYAKPVIGGPAHGLDALIEGNGGGLIAAQTGPSIAAAIRDLLADPDRRAAMGRRGQRLVETHYSVDALVGTLEDVYRTVQGHPVREAIPKRRYRFER